MNKFLEEVLWQFDLVQNGLRLEEQEESPGGEQEEEGVILKDEDGNTLIKVEEGEEGPEAGSDKEKPAEEKPKPKETDDDDDDPGEVIDDAYKGKSNTEIIEMHKNAEKLISKQGEELSKYKKDEELETLSPEELAARIPAADLEKVYTDVRTKLVKAENKLAKLKDMSSDEDAISNAEKDVAELSTKVIQTEKDWLKKRQDESINGKFTAVDNDTFIKDHTASMKKADLDIPEAELPALFDKAKEFTGDGKLTVEAVGHAMLEIYGAEKTQLFYTISGNTKARKEIKTANAKVRPKVDTNLSSKKGKYIRLNQASPGQIKKAVRDMSPEELYKN